MNLYYVTLAKSHIDQVLIDIKYEIGSSVPFVGGKTLVKLHFKRIKKDFCSRKTKVTPTVEDVLGQETPRIL